MKKIIYIIPGFLENAKQEKYKEITKFFKKNGFTVIPANITWKYKIMNDYIDEFNSQYNKHDKNDEIYLFGFSFGAMISFFVSGDVKPKAQFLCSLSPYFKEDIPHIREWWKKYKGLKRISNFKILSFNNFSKMIKCKTFIFAGTKEGPEIERRARLANKQIKNSELFMIDGGKHDISQDIYTDKIKKIISKNFNCKI